MTHQSSVKRGLAWSATERFATQFIQFLVAVVLARILTPNDFGLVAIVYVFTTIFQTINESGFNTALIHKLDRSAIDYSTALYTNIVIGLVGYGILFIASPYIATFYNTPELTKIMRCLSLTIVINSLGIVQNAKYTINVDFQSIAKASVTAAIISGIVSIIYAYISHSVYAIVLQSITYSSVNVFLLWVLGRWIPRTGFSKTSFKELFNYAYKLILARLISVIFDDIYSLAIGKIYTPTSLAFYNRANSFQQLLSKNIINIIQRVSIPVLCKSQNDLPDMRNVLLHFVKIAASIVYPLLAMLMALGYPLIYVVLGPQWIGAVEYLYFICPIGFFYLISTFNRNVFNATGRTDWALKSEIVKKCLFIIVFLLTMRYDIRILLAGLIFDSVIEMCYDMHYSKKQIGIKFSEQLKNILPILLASIIMTIATLLIIQPITNPYVSLFVGGITGAVVYCIICYIGNIANFRSYIEKF